MKDISSIWKIAIGLAIGAAGAWLIQGQLADLAKDDLRRQSVDDARRAAEQTKAQPVAAPTSSP